MDATYAETIVFRFIGYNLLGSAVRDVSGMLGGLGGLAAKASDDIGANLSKAGGMVASFGSALMLGSVLAAGGMVYASSKAAEFNSQMILLHTQARVATSQLQDLGQGVLDMAGNVGFAPTELAKALYFIESVGGGSYTTAHALDELKAAAMGAAVGHSDLAVTASNLASVMAVFPGLLPIQAMGQLDAIVGQGKMTMEDLNGALKTGILATLQSSGVSLADFGGALATMTDYAIPATQAANSLRMAVYLIDAPTAASNKVLKEFGLTTAEANTASQAWTDALARAGVRHAKLADDLRKPGGIILAMEDLRASFAKAGLDANAQAEVIYKAFGGGKMGKAILTLYENIGSGAQASDEKLKALGFTSDEVATLHDRLITKTALINQQTNLLGQNFQFIQQNDPVQMWNDLRAGIDAVVISLGEAFLPVMLSIVNFIRPLVAAFADWTLHNQSLVRTLGIAAVVIMAISGAAMILVGTIGIIAGTIASLAAIGIGATILPLVAILFVVGAAVAAVALLIITHWDQAKAVFRAVMSWMKPVFDEIGNAMNFLRPIVMQAFDGIVKSIQPVIAYILPQLAAAWMKLGPILGPLMKNLWDITKPFIVISAIILGALLSGAFKMLLGFLMTALPAAINIAIDVLQLLGAIIKFIADIFRNVAAIVDDVIHGRWQKAMDDLGKLFFQMGEDIMFILGWLVKTVVDLVVGLAETLIGTVAGLVMGIVGFFQWLFNQLVGHSLIPDLVNGIVKWIGSLPGRILNALSGMASLLFQVGRDLVQGMINGIANMWSALVGWLSSKVHDLPGPIKKFLGISSPSALFAKEVGAPIVQGIWMGMQTEQPVLEKNIQNMVTAKLPSAPVKISTPGNSSTDLLEDIKNILTQIANGSPRKGSATGVEALIYEITKKADINRNRGMKGYAQ